VPLPPPEPCRLARGKQAGISLVAWQMFRRFGRLVSVVELPGQITPRKDACGSALRVV
jgi:hypothetical protein